MSRMSPVSLLMACWRCRTKDREPSEGPEDEVSVLLVPPIGVLVPSPATWTSGGGNFLFGFNVTAIVVPKREWRELTLRAITCRVFVSAASNRWRFSAGCW